MLTCGFTYPEPAEVTLNVNVPPTPTVALITAPEPAPPPSPTFIVMVSSVTAVIVVCWPTIGSPLDDVGVGPERGYGCNDEKWSFEHLNTIPPVSIPTVSLTAKSWSGIVITKTPVLDV